MLKDYVIHCILQYSGRKRKPTGFFFTYLPYSILIACVYIYAYICLHIYNGFFSSGARKLLLIVQVNYRETD